MTQNNIPQDPRPLFDRALDIAGKVIDGVAPGQLEAPTPCSEYDVRLLLGHMVAVLDRVAVVGTGADWSTTPQIVEGVDDGGWTDAWAGARAGPEIAERASRHMFAEHGEASIEHLATRGLIERPAHEASRPAQRVNPHLSQESARAGKQDSD